MPASDQHHQDFAPAPDPARPPQPAAAPGSRFAGLRRFFWPALWLFQVGLLVGIFALGRPPAGPHSPAPPEHEADQPSVTLPYSERKTEQPSAALTKSADLRRGDALLRDGKYEAALAEYPSGSPLPDVVQYRLGLCLEGLGRWDQALAAYRETTSRAANSRTYTAAHFGQARILVRLGRPAEATLLLNALLLRAAQPQAIDPSFLADASYLLALTSTREAMPPPQPWSHQRTVASHPDADWPIPLLLSWVTPTGAPKAGRKGKDLAGELTVGPQPGANGEDLFVSGAPPEMPTADLLEQLARLGKLRPEWTAAARQAVADRTAAVALDGWPLQEVFQALGDTLGVTWTVKDGVLHFARVEEVPKVQLAAYRAAAARRALQKAILTYPDHALTPAAYLEMGNFDFRSGKITEAAGWYERLLRQAPRSRLAAEASYNLGLAHWELGNTRAARKALYSVVDRAPGHRLAPLAFLRVGQLHLAEGQPREALPPLVRATGTSPGSPAAAAAAVTLAAGYLLVGDPAAAHATLLKARDQVDAGAPQRTAAFLDALARYRLKAAQNQVVRREAGDLLAALLEVPADSPLGDVATLLLGQAYHDLGMDQQMAGVYEKAQGKARGSPAAEMSLALGDYWIQGEKRAAGARLLSSLAGQDVGRWAQLARLKLAALALREDRARDCLQECTTLLQAADPVDRPAVLHLMGSAFDRLGEHRQAARCFAGQAPE